MLITLIKYEIKYHGIHKLLRQNKIAKYINILYFHKQMATPTLILNKTYISSLQFIYRYIYINIA